jgi:electron transport complex protein RnfG
MIRTLGLVSAICGLIIVGAYQGTYDAVAANKRIATERAVFKVLPKAKSMPSSSRSRGEYQESARRHGDSTGWSEILRRLRRSRQARRHCRRGRGQGLCRQRAHHVRLPAGLPVRGRHRRGGMRETPGIGDKIITDKDFLANFTALDVKLKADLSALANEVKAVKHGTKTGAWQIDAIAGATITSRAVGKAINDSAQALLPRLVPKLDTLAKKS